MVKWLCLFFLGSESFSHLTGGITLLLRHPPAPEASLPCCRCWTCRGVLWRRWVSRTRTLGKILSAPCALAVKNLGRRELQAENRGSKSDHKKLAGLVALHLILTASQGHSFPGESETCMKLEWRTVPRCNYQTYVLYHLPKLQAPAISRRWFNQWGHRSSHSGTPGLHAALQYLKIDYETVSFFWAQTSLTRSKLIHWSIVIIISGPWGLFSSWEGPVQLDSERVWVKTWAPGRSARHAYIVAKTCGFCKYSVNTIKYVQIHESIHR